jgi:hypothetical protein
MTCAHKNVESVQCQIDNDDKEGVTVIAAVDAEGRKCPLTLIGKGKTQRCLAGYELPSRIARKLSRQLPNYGRLNLSLFPLTAPTSFNHEIAAYLVS